PEARGNIPKAARPPSQASRGSMSNRAVPVTTDAEISNSSMVTDTGSPSMARVLFVSYDFPPSAMPGAASCAEMLRYLRLYGWEPLVLTARERHYDTLDPRRQPPVPVLRTLRLPHPLEIYRRIRDQAGDGANGSESADRSRGTQTDA